MNDVTVLVLGASGRVGRHLVPRLREIGYPVIAVSRSPRPASLPDGVIWLCRDLSQQPADLIDELSRRVPGRLVIADLVLDRATTRRMQKSIRAATETTLAWASLSARHGGHVRIVSASTTAVLAPVGLRTQYGRSKRHQAERYAHHGDTDIVLLPQLAAENCTTHGWAADALAEVMGAESSPEGPRLWVMPPGSRPEVVSTSAAGFLRSQVEAIRHRQDPAARRRATHARLALLPQPVRDQLDHHRTPPRLLQDFVERLKVVAVRRIPSAATHEERS